MTLVTAANRVAELEAIVARLSGSAPAAASVSFAATLERAAGSSPQGSFPATAQTAATGVGGDVPYGELIDQAAARYGIDRNVLRGLIRAESGFNPRATSPAGAAGLTQLMPATARALGVSDPYEPAQAIDAGARYLRQQLDAFGGDYRLALAAYNAGPAAVRRFGGVPPYAETRAYVQRVLAYAAAYEQGGAA